MKTEQEIEEKIGELEEDIEHGAPYYDTQAKVDALLWALGEEVEL